MDAILDGVPEDDYLGALEAARIEARRNYVPRIYGVGDLVAAPALYDLRPDWAALFPVRADGGGGGGD
jgi:hypothetical protein